MTKAPELLRELMQKHDELAAKWKTKYGTLDGFHDWFTRQVLGKRS